MQMSHVNLKIKNYIQLFKKITEDGLAWQYQL